MTNFILAVICIMLGQQALLVTQFAWHRPKFWRFSPTWLRHSRYREWLGKRWYVNSPVKWLQWAVLAFGILGGYLDMAGAICGLILALVTFNLFYHGLYVKPEMRHLDEEDVW